MLDFVDREIVEALSYHLRRQDAVFRLGEKVTAVGVNERGQVQVMMESGKRLRAEGLLYAAGRQANTDLLNLAAAGPGFPVVDQKLSGRFMVWISPISVGEFSRRLTVSNAQAMTYALKFNEILIGLPGTEVAFLENIARPSLTQSCKHEQRQYALRGCDVSLVFVHLLNNSV
jgi:hypothetical protein